MDISYSVVVISSFFCYLSAINLAADTEKQVVLRTSLNSGAHPAYLYSALFMRNLREEIRCCIHNTFVLN
jgi:hypothetical protein